MPSREIGTDGSAHKRNAYTSSPAVQASRAVARPCQQQPQLFDSTSPALHRRARELCLACPVQVECLAEALGLQLAAAGESTGHDLPIIASGTWGARLFRDGRLT